LFLNKSFADRRHYHSPAMHCSGLNRGTLSGFRLQTSLSTGTVT
jgi:hypothetical protein